MTEEEWLALADAEAMLAYAACREAAPGDVLPITPLSERKLRLFLAACCRRQWGLFGAPACREAVLVAERHADGSADDPEREAAHHSALALRDRLMETPPPERQGWMAMQIAEAAFLACWSFAELLRKEILFTGTRVGAAQEPEPAYPPDWKIQANYCQSAVAEAAAEHHCGPRSEENRERWARCAVEVAAQADLLRCVAGNPFRPVTVAPTWRTPTVLSLAQAAYDERLMPKGELDPARLAVLADALEEACCDSADLLAHLRSPGPHVRGCWALDLILGKE